VEDNKISQVDDEEQNASHRVPCLRYMRLQQEESRSENATKLLIA